MGNDARIFRGSVWGNGVMERWSDGDERREAFTQEHFGAEILSLV